MYRMHLRPATPVPKLRPAKEIALESRRAARRSAQEKRPPKPAA